VLYFWLEEMSKAKRAVALSLLP